MDWLEPFSIGALENLTWYNSLGNHEYGYDVDAQLELAKMYDRWILDNRYYSRRLEIGSTGAFVTFLVLDTTPCNQAFRADDPSGWDPCSSDYPTCSVADTDDDFEGACLFHEHVLTQECGPQFTWFKDQLENVDKDDWLIVVGHNPADEIDVYDFTSAMQDHGFDLYLNGHVHTLTQYTIDGGGSYVTSGAGAMVATPDQHKGTIPLRLNGGSVTSAGNHTYQAGVRSLSISARRSPFGLILAALDCGRRPRSNAGEASTNARDPQVRHGF